MEQTLMTAPTAKMMQASMNANSMKAKLEKEEEEKKVKAKNEDLSFHEKEVMRMQNDPNNVIHQAAIAIGKKNAEEFINSALDRNHPDHNKNFPVFRDVYGLDTAKCSQDFIDKSCSDMKTRAYEKKDPAYEANVLRLYKPVGNVTTMKQKLYQNFVDGASDKWKKSGYQFDSDYIDKLAKNYILQRNEGLSDLKDFQLKK